MNHSLEDIMEDLKRPNAKRRPKAAAPRRGAALLLCMFFILVVTMLALHVYDSITVETSALRNTIEYERALYLANAGVHHAAAMLEASSTWTGTVSQGTFPADDSYTATAATGANHTVVVTSQGAAGNVTRTVTATIEP